MEEEIKALKYIPRFIDESNTSITYIGYASVSTPSYSKLWIVKRVFTDSGATEIAYAKGSWDNRVSLIFM